MNTAGGSETDPLSVDRLMDHSGAGYELTVRIIQVTPPHAGASFTVNMETAWTLVRVAGGFLAMRKGIHSTNTATIDDKITGVARMRVALEGVARENIELGLREIGSLAL